MGFLSKIGNSLTRNFWDSNKETTDALSSYNASNEAAKKQLSAQYGTAHDQLAAGYKDAQATANQGYDAARDTTASGYANARNEFSSGYDNAANTAREGYAEAKGYYETPEMVSSRQELYNRVLGKGGMSDETLEMQKAKAREEYGTGLRSVQDSLSSMYGDSSAEGLAGENLARAAASLGAQRANTVRDIDIGNEQMKRDEMTGAIGSLQQEAGARASLSADEAQYVSGLEARAAEGLSNLTAAETNALAQIAEGKGTTLAELQAALASGEATLTSEEAKALAELTSAQSTGALTVGTQKNLLQSLWG